MAKKFVRGITDVKTINNQDYDTNNVNDLLSDGQYNYIHRKKGKNEEYHNLTDNIKTLSSDNTELLAVTNYNKTTNTALLSPKHDAQKEQVLESTRNTVTINHGTNGTAEKTTVDTNPEKVLEHENLITDYGISKNTTGNTTKLGLEFTMVENGFDLNNLHTGNVRGEKLVNAPNNDMQWFLVSSKPLGGNHYGIQEATTVLNTPNITYRRTKKADVWGPWREQVGDRSVIDALLAQKQDKLTAGEGITIDGQTIDTNPQKVLEHDNLLTVDGISKVTTGNSTTIGLKIIDNYAGDLNELTETCLVRPTNDAGNLSGSGHGGGILTVVKIGDIVSQKNHSLANEVYTRLGAYIEGAWEWTKWIRASGATAS